MIFAEYLCREGAVRVDGSRPGRDRMGPALHILDELACAETFGDEVGWFWLNQAAAS